MRPVAATDAELVEAWCAFPGRGPTLSVRRVTDVIYGECLRQAEPFERPPDDLAQAAMLKLLVRVRRKGPLPDPAHGARTVRRYIRRTVGRLHLDQQRPEDYPEEPLDPEADSVSQVDLGGFQELLMDLLVDNPALDAKLTGRRRDELETRIRMKCGHLKWRELTGIDPESPGFALVRGRWYKRFERLTAVLEHEFSRRRPDLGFEELRCLRQLIDGVAPKKTARKNRTRVVRVPPSAASTEATGLPE